MGQQHESLICAHCSERTMHVKQTVNHTLHIILSICTAGLWLAVYIFVIVSSKEQFRCTKCGTPAGAQSLIPMPPKPTAVQAAPMSDNAADQVRKLHELHLQGALSEQEFEAAKRKALGL